MATNIIGASTAAPIPRERGTVEFFTLNGKYLIDSSATAQQLGDDLACFNGSLVAILEALVDATESTDYSALAFAALYQARQASAVAQAHAMQLQRDAAEAHMLPLGGAQ